MTRVNHFDPRSFRDPDGVLTTADERVFRLLTAEAAERLNDVLARPAVRAGIASGKIVATRLASPASLPPALRDLGCVVYEHDLIPFVSYAYEWPPAMLAHAAAFTLELSQELLQDDLILKDATPANVLFRGCQPVFVDVLSMVPRTAGSYLWLAGNQFETTFLLPLIGNAEVGLPLAWSLQDTFSGISHRQMARLVGMRRWLKPSLFASVAVPAALSKDNAPRAGATPKHPNDEAAKYIFRSTLSRLQRRLGRITRRRSTSSFWQQYTANRVHYAASDLAEKKAFVAAALEEVRPRWTLDIGANTGEFSSLSAQHSSVVALEIDETSADEIFRRARTGGLDIQPLVGNFARPSAAFGWRNGEMQAFLERANARFNLVLMLAVVHHLRIAAGIPIAAILDAVAALTRSHLIVEHVPPTDTMFRQLARGREGLYSDCEPDAFEAELGRRFSIARKQALANGRTLYLGKRLIAN